MEVLQLAPSSGWNWIRQGFALFSQNRMIWIALIFFYLLIMLSLYFFIPVIGWILFYLIDPVFVAGFMLGCRALHTGEALNIHHLLSAFNEKAARLVTVGGVNLVGRLLILGPMALVFANLGYGTYLDKIQQGNYDWLFTSGIELTLLVWMSLFLVLMLPLYMAYWFSPALVEFENIEPIDAIKLSIKGCWRNPKAFLVYGLSFIALMIGFFLGVSLIGAALTFVALILGNGVFIKILIAMIGMLLALGCWVGVQILIITSQFASYREIFRAPEESDGMMAL